MRDKIIVAIVDDHPLVIAGTVALLKTYTHIKVAGTYSSASALMAGLQEQVPDVLLLDLMLPDRPAKTLLPELVQLYPELTILALTSIDTPAVVSSMMRRGCKGYLLKGAGPETLAMAIETVYKGEEFIEPSLKDILLQSVLNYKARQADNTLLPDLSEREKEILQLIAQEYTTREIADKLFISFRTAENHRYNLLQKLDVKNTVGLVKAAIQLGLI